VYLVFHSTNSVTTDGYPLFHHEMLRWISDSLFGYRFWVIASILATITMIQIYFTQNNFIQKTSLLPSIFYLLMVISSGVIQNPESILISNFFIILIYISLYSYFKSNSKSKLFFTGLFFGIAILFDFAIIPLFIFIIIALIINTVISPKALLILLYGIISVVIYVIAIYYFMDQLNQLYAHFNQLKINTIFLFKVNIKPAQYVFIPISTIAFLFILYKINAVYENKVIIMRKKMFTFNTLLFCLLGTLLITNGNPTHFIGYFFVPLSMLLSIFSQFKSRFYIYDFLTIIFIIGIWF